MPSWVYFLRPIGMDGPVKIGCSTVPENRLGLYMAWAPFPLEIAARVPGDYRLEARFHCLFRDQHSHHEWFKPSPVLTQAIADIVAGIFDIDALPPPKRLPANRTHSPERRETQGIMISLNARTFARGLSAPPHVKEAANALYRSTGDERLRLMKVVRDFLVDPLANGAVIGPYSHSQKRWEEYQARLARGRKRAA